MSLNVNNIATERVQFKEIGTVLPKERVEKRKVALPPSNKTTPATTSIQDPLAGHVPTGNGQVDPDRMFTLFDAIACITMSFIGQGKVTNSIMQDMTGLTNQMENVANETLKYEQSFRALQNQLMKEENGPEWEKITGQVISGFLGAAMAIFAGPVAVVVFLAITTAKDCMSDIKLSPPTKEKPYWHCTKDGQYSAWDAMVSKVKSPAGKAWAIFGAELFMTLIAGVVGAVSVTMMAKKAAQTADEITSTLEEEGGATTAVEMNEINPEEEGQSIVAREDQEINESQKTDEGFLKRAYGKVQSVASKPGSRIFAFTAGTLGSLSKGVEIHPYNVSMRELSNHTHPMQKLFKSGEKPESSTDESLSVWQIWFTGGDVNKKASGWMNLPGYILDAAYLFGSMGAAGALETVGKEASETLQKALKIMQPTLMILEGVIQAQTAVKEHKVEKLSKELATMTQTMTRMEKDTTLLEILKSAYSGEIKSMLKQMSETMGSISFAVQEIRSQLVYGG